MPSSTFYWSLFISQEPEGMSIGKVILCIVQKQHLLLKLKYVGCTIVSCWPTVDGSQELLSHCTRSMANSISALSLSLSLFLAWLNTNVPWVQHVAIKCYGIEYIRPLIKFEIESSILTLGLAALSSLEIFVVLLPCCLAMFSLRVYLVHGILLYHTLISASLSLSFFRSLIFNLSSSFYRSVLLYPPFSS